MHNMATGVGAKAAASVVCYALGPGLRNTLPLSVESPGEGRWLAWQKGLARMRRFFLFARHSAPWGRSTLPLSAEGAQRERMTNMEKAIDAVCGDCFFLLDTSSRACSTLPLSVEQAVLGPCKRVKRALVQMHQRLFSSVFLQATTKSVIIEMNYI